MVLESNMFRTEQELPDLVLNRIEIDNEKCVWCSKGII